MFLYHMKLFFLKELVFDAGHEYDDVKNDINNWFYKVKPGGIIAGDDFGTNLFEGLTKAVDEYFYGQVETKEGWVRFRKRPRIQIIHMMTNPNDIRERVVSLPNALGEAFGLFLFALGALIKVCLLFYELRG